MVVAYLRLAIGAGGLATVSLRRAPGLPLPRPDHPSRRTARPRRRDRRRLGQDGRDGAAVLGVFHPSGRRTAHQTFRRRRRRRAVGAGAAADRSVRAAAGCARSARGSGPGCPRALGADVAELVEVLGAASVPQAHRDRLTSDLSRGTGTVIEARDATGVMLGFVWYTTADHPPRTARGSGVRADPGGIGDRAGAGQCAAGGRDDRPARQSRRRANAVRRCRCCGSTPTTMPRCACADCSATSRRIRTRATRWAGPTSRRRCSADLNSFRTNTVGYTYRSSL